MKLDRSGLDPLYAPWAEHLAAGEFAMPRCTGCGAFHFYPQPACPACRCDALEWVAVSGEGTVYSFSIVHRAPDPRFAAEVPYVVAIIASREGPHLLGRIAGIAPESVAIGMPVRIRLASASADVEEIEMPTFEPMEAAP